MMPVPKEKRENGYRSRKNDAGTQRETRKWVQEGKNDASTQKKFKSPAESFAGRHIFQRKV